MPKHLLTAISDVMNTSPFWTRFARRRDWTMEKCLIVYSRRLGGMFGFTLLGVVITLVLVYAISPPPSSPSEPDPADELARNMAILNCSCAGEKRVRRREKTGEQEPPPPPS